jgi:hypothetical protein
MNLYVFLRDPQLLAKSAGEPRRLIPILIKGRVSSHNMNNAIRGSPFAKRCTVQSMSCRPTWTCGSENTMNKGRIRDAGASAKRRCRHKIGLQNLAYNIRRLVTLERIATA